MTQFVPITTSDVVALRKESVDRNFFARVGVGDPDLVALRKESVDRNVQNYDTGVWAGSRSPQGERG